jgi:hypothetical protein
MIQVKMQQQQQAQYYQPQPMYQPQGVPGMYAPTAPMSVAPVFDMGGSTAPVNNAPAPLQMQQPVPYEAVQSSKLLVSDKLFTLRPATSTVPSGAFNEISTWVSNDPSFNVKASFIDYHLKCRSKLDAIRSFYRNYPAQERRGSWVYIMRYTELKKVNMPTVAYKDLIDKLATNLSNSDHASVRDIRTAAKSFSYEVFEDIAKIICQELNDVFPRVMRFHQNPIAKIENIQESDIEKIYDPNTPIKFFQHVKFSERLNWTEHLIRSAVLNRHICDKTNAVDALLQCDGINWFDPENPDMTKESVLMGTDEVLKGNLIDKFLNEFTILKTQKYIAITNMIDGKNPEDGLGVFNHLARKFGSFYSVSDVVSLQPTTSPRDFIKFYKPGITMDLEHPTVILDPSTVNIGFEDF